MRFDHVRTRGSVWPWAAFGTLALHALFGWALAAAPTPAPTLAAPVASPWMQFETLPVQPDASRAAEEAVAVASKKRPRASSPSGAPAPRRTKPASRESTRAVANDVPVAPTLPSATDVAATQSAPAAFDALLAGLVGQDADLGMADSQAATARGAVAPARGQGARAAAAAAPARLTLGASCAGFFPSDAHTDHGVVRLDVWVAEDGHVRTSKVLHQAPLREGFDRAASACARRLRFEPARDATGHAVSSHAQLELEFSRSS